MAEKPSSERKKFKDWFDQAAVLAWVEQVTAVYPEFNGSRFEQLASDGLETLEFKARILQFTRALAETLPSDKAKALQILRESLPRERPGCDNSTDGWLQWPLGEFVAEYGQDHFQESWETMVELTQCFTAEFAIRPFMERFQEQTISQLKGLTGHPNPHVRRWCSEGTRPRLPWGSVLQELVRDPTPIWPLLEALKDDPELYVRRSVANNLNDIAKDHPELVVERCRQWKVSSNPERDWVIKHALRTLVKNAHPGALELLGFGKPSLKKPKLEVSPKSIGLGEYVVLKTFLTNSLQRQQKIQLDYVVHYIRQKGAISEKVFKWKTLTLKGSERVELVKKHAMKATTIRALYAGMHKVEIQVNGRRLAAAEFEFRGEA